MAGVDWPDLTTTEKSKALEVIEGVEREIERTVEHRRPATSKRFITFTRCNSARTTDPADAHSGSSGGNHVPSLTPTGEGLSSRSGGI